MNYQPWDFENDIIVKKGNLMFPAKTASGLMGSAYAVETEKGIFYQKMRPDGNFNLHHVDTNGESVFLENIVVAASDMNYTAIIVYHLPSGEFYLIDVRGDFFLVEVSKGENINPCQYRMKLDKSTGYINVENKAGIVRWMIRAVDKRTQLESVLKSAPTGEWTLNPKFKSLFSKKMAGQYHYLTLHNTQKGKLINELIKDELPYEVVPNMFLEDDSQNIRIPINEETLAKVAMHFVLEKYPNTYSIAGIPLEKYIGTIDISYKEKEKLFIVYSMASDAQYSKVMSIVNTLKGYYEVATDADLYKKTFKKIAGLFVRKCDIEGYKNYFENMELPYPDSSFHGYDVSKEIIKERLDYINSCLIPDRPISNVDGIDREEMRVLYKQLYDLSKKYRKEQMNAFEDAVLSGAGYEVKARVEKPQEKKIDEVMNDIVSGLTGDTEKDIKYLELQRQKYNNHSFKYEISSRIGKLTLDLFPKEKKVDDMWPSEQDGKAQNTTEREYEKADNQLIQLFESTLNDILPGLTMYARDVNLNNHCADKYIPDTIILERGFTDASSRVMGMKTTHRFAILSNHMMDFSAFEHDTNWGLFVAQNSSHFLVLDNYTYHGKTQILLLHLPNDKRWKLFKDVKINVLDSIVADSRRRFENKCESEVVPELATEEWLSRCDFPLGMDEYGNKYDLDVILEHKLKKIGNTSFRDLFHNLVYIRANEKMMNSLKDTIEIYPEDDGFLAYGYIDEQAGFSFELLCAANINNNKLTRRAFNESVILLVRKCEMNEAVYMNLDYCDVYTKDFEEMIQSVNQIYACKDEKVLEMRNFTFLDSVRNIDYPDDIAVYLTKEGLQPEQVWVKCHSFTESELFGILLNEPNQNYGVHRGDVIGFCLAKKQGNTICIFTGNKL